MRDAPNHQYHGQQRHGACGRYACGHAQREQQRKGHGRAERAAVHITSTQGIADQADRAEAHQPPTHLSRFDARDAFQRVSQVGVGTEHGREQQDGQQQVGEEERIPENFCLLGEADFCGRFDTRHRQCQQQSH